MPLSTRERRDQDASVATSFDSSTGPKSDNYGQMGTGGSTKDNTGRIVKLRERQKNLKKKLKGRRFALKNFKQYVKGGAGLNTPVRKSLQTHLRKATEQTSDWKKEKNRVSTRVNRLGG